MTDVRAVHAIADDDQPLLARHGRRSGFLRS